MKIRKLQLKNIGVFDDETIEFQECPEGKAEIHIFTGQNGSGKTTILQALSGIFLFIDKDKDEYINCFDFDQLSLETEISIYKRIRYFESGGEHEDYENKSQINVFSEWSDEVPAGSIEGLPHTTFGSPTIKVSTLDDEARNFKFARNASYSPNVNFAAFAYSGYRRLKAEKITAIKDYTKNPLSEALEFVKTENRDFTINQWIANTISKSALEEVKNNRSKSNKFSKNIETFEYIIAEITGNTVKFELETEPLSLILVENGKKLDLDILPDGFKSLVSWIGDLLMRIDSLKWDDTNQIFEKNIIIFLDEIEVHLHPAWQRKVLPVVQKLFKNAQIFVSTHSPFVVNSIDDAWVYKLELENGKSRVSEPIESENSNSITQVLREIFGVDYWFGWEVQKNFDEFKKLKNKIISNGADSRAEKQLLEKARILADEPNDQLKQLIREELEDLSEIKQKTYSL